MPKNLFAEVPKSGGSLPGQAVRRNLKDIQRLVGEVRPDDGIDPRYVTRHRKSAGPERPGRSHGEHKQAQLFAQVREAVDGALQTAHDPCLSRLSAVDVNQSGGSFVIVVQPREPGEVVDLAEAQVALEAARSMLRREIAAAISRKQTPNLQFVVLPAGAEPTE